MLAVLFSQFGNIFMPSIEMTEDSSYKKLSKKSRIDNKIGSFKHFFSNKL